MRIRVFASLRQAAGGPWIEASGATLRELLGDAASRYPIGEQLRHCKVVLNDEPVTDLDTAISDGDEVALLPPVAGG